MAEYGTNARISLVDREDTCQFTRLMRALVPNYAMCEQYQQDHAQHPL